MVMIERDLFSPLGIFFLIVFGIESTVSLLGNGFILAMNGHSWLRSKKMLLCDFLLTTVSFSRFLFQLVAMSSQFVFSNSPEIYIDSEIEQVFALSWHYLNITNLWCATWLNVFYCVKVTNFPHPFFAWLKLRIGVLVPRFLGISLLAFIICSIHPVMRSFENEKCCNLTGNLPENSSQMEEHPRYSRMFFKTIQIYFTAINFSICFTASVVLLLSLWRHKRNLKKGGFSPKDLSTQAHLRVMKPLLLSLFFYILHFVAIIFVLSNVFEFGKLEQLICEIFLSLYPSAHSVILIFTNPKLRKACTHVLNLRRSAP